MTVEPWVVKAVLVCGVLFIVVAVLMWAARDVRR